MTLVVVGIDPGTKGGIAALDVERGKVFLAQAFTPDMPVDEVAGWVRSALNLGPIKGVYLEQVGHIKGDGARGAFTFGGAYRLIEGLLLGQGVKPKYVPQAFWQARMGCLSGGNKSLTLARAKALFGDQVKVTHGNADALLIAAYGRMALV